MPAVNDPAGGSPVQTVAQALSKRNLQLFRHPERPLKPGDGHRYDGAGHGFFYYHTPMYRPEAAMDGWEKVFSFFGRHLKG
jgi:dienelactone hydrolase